LQVVDLEIVFIWTTFVSMMFMEVRLTQTTGTALQYNLLEMSLLVTILAWLFAGILPAGGGYVSAIAMYGFHLKLLKSCVGGL
jgi:hypothetical protein